jgi:hypothetical protein
MATLTQVRETTRFLEAGSRSRMLAAGAAQVLPDGITRETIRSLSQRITGPPSASSLSTGQVAICSGQ